MTRRIFIFSCLLLLAFLAPGVRAGEEYADLTRRIHQSLLSADSLKSPELKTSCALALALHAMGRLPEAEVHLEKLVKENPGSADLHHYYGAVLRDAGKYADAGRHFRRAVELSPGRYDFRTGLGHVALLSGKWEEALTQFRKALELDPNHPVTHFNLASALLPLDRLDESFREAVEALKLDPAFVPAYLLLSDIFERDGDATRALVWLEQGIEIVPDAVPLWERLARWNEEVENRRAAIAAYEKMLELGARPAPVHSRLGHIFQDTEDYEKAIAHYREALRQEPGMATPHVDLSSAFEELGKLEEAQEELRKALELEPNHPLANARLAMLLKKKLPEPELARVRELLENARLNDADRSNLFFGLAHVLDARGEFAEAAKAIREANAAALRVAKQRHREYSPEQHEHFVDGLIQVFNKEFFERLRGTGSSSATPVFVVGMPRSGTTLTEQVLASHPDIHGAGERRFAHDSFVSISEVVGCPGKPPLECLTHLDEAGVRRIAEGHLEWLKALNLKNAARIVDKMPDNYLYLGLLATLFPKATFIHCKRDARDIAVSCWMANFRSIRWANTPEHIAHRYRQYEKLMAHWRAVLPVPIHEVSYEEVVEDLERSARRLIAACGREWSPACLEFHRNKRPVRTASVTQVREPVYRRSVERWRNYEELLPEFFAPLKGLTPPRP